MLTVRLVCILAVVPCAFAFRYPLQHLPAIPEGPGIKAVHHESASELPTDFDGRKQWPGCIHPVLNQGHCGSCWAFAATETLSDRFCIHSNASIDVVLSPQDLLSCEKENLGCTLGSLPQFAWHYFQETGVATMACVPYVSGDGHVPHCRHGCSVNGVNYTLYKVKDYEHVGSLFHPTAPEHERAIQEALLQGPVDATFNVYADFEQYRGGVYVRKSHKYEGLHSVKVVGWGVEGDLPYWLVQNSWGPNWGLNGFFKFLRGGDQCGFETLMYTGTPLL